MMLRDVEQTVTTLKTDKGTHEEIHESSKEHLITLGGNAAVLFTLIAESWSSQRICTV